MHEYLVTLLCDGVSEAVVIFAPTAAAARRQAEDQYAGEVTALRFVRAAGVSCTIRDGRARR